MPKTRTKPSAVRKKKFQGNQYSAERDMDFVSSSAKKIKACNYDDVILDSNSSYVICNFFLIFNALSEFLVCKSCAGNVKFRRTLGPGVGFKLIVDCSCDIRQIPSSPMSGKVYEINQRLMFAFRILGCGLQSLKIFCSLLDITHTFSTAMYYAVIEKIYIAAKATFEVIQKKAVSEEVEANAAAGNEPRHVSVSGDGSWKKRGFSSLYGIVSLIGKYTGKVVDVCVKSAYCQSCTYWSLRQGTPEYDKWRADHDETCTANHTGSAGKMEVDCVKEMFLRSEEQLGVKYKNYIGDGDSKTFKALLDTDPYDDLTVTKKECVGHVQKRMGTRLRKLKKETKGLGGKGKGKLTDKLIADLTMYYGLAIRRNADSAEKMKDAIWATYFHKCSTNDNPQHHLCPEGGDSWCKWRVAEKEGSLGTFEHPHALDKKVQEAIKPIYTALSADDLLERCTGANTQNSNESFNSTVWRMAPKHLHSGSKIIWIATYVAAGLFNEGRSVLLKILNALGVGVGMEASRYASEADTSRILEAERKLSAAARNARIAQRIQENVHLDIYEIEEDPFYGAGIAD